MFYATFFQRGPDISVTMLRATVSHGPRVIKLSHLEEIHLALPKAEEPLLVPARCGKAVRKHARLANNSAQISVRFIVKMSIDGPDLLKSVSTRKFSLL